MKKFAALLSLLLFITPLAGCGTKTLEDGVLTIGLECGYAPFNWTTTSSGEGAVAIANSGFLGIGRTYCAGYDITVASHIAQELGYTLRVRKISWDGLIPALNSGNIDAIIAGMTDTATRRESVSFTAPYYESQLVMLVRASSSYASATDIQGFAGARLAAQVGTVQNDLIGEFAEEVTGLVHATPYETYPDALLALLEANSGLDGVLAERPIGEAMLAQYPTQLAMVEFFSAPSVYDEDFVITVSIAVRQNATALRDAMDAVLAAISVSTRIEWMEAAIAADKG